VNPGGQKSVCLITPGQPSTNPRLVKEADALSEAGYRVHVIAGRFVEWAEEADREFQGRPWTIEYLPFGPRAPRSVYLRQAVRRRLCRALATRLGYPLPLVECGYHDVLPTLKRTAARCPADLYIAHNLAALPAAVKAAEARGARAGFDAEDFHSGELPERPENVPRVRMTKAIESAYLRRCDYVTAASPGIARAYAAAYGIPVPDVVLNVFPLRDRPVGATARQSRERRSVYWFSQTIGPDRGLETVLEAVAQSRSRPDIFLRGRASAGYKDFLGALSRRLGIEEHLHFLDVAAPGEMVRAAAEYDIGLATEVVTCSNKDLALSNKIFTYLLAGIPVIASDTLAQKEIAAQCPECILLYENGNVASLSRAIDMLCGDRGALSLAGRAAAEIAEKRYNWDVESTSFLRVIDRTLQGAVL
jgi:glycosyltransferase involved in cell wall biosynthesis